MIKNEAIQRLKEARDTIQPFRYVNEAIDYTIKVLEQEPQPLYSIDRKKALVEAAKNIKEYCQNHQCVDCPFHRPEVWEECAISSRDYLDVTYPKRWEV